MTFFHIICICFMVDKLVLNSSLGERHSQQSLIVCSSSSAGGYPEVSFILPGLPTGMVIAQVYLGHSLEFISVVFLSYIEDTVSR